MLRRKRWPGPGSDPHARMPNCWPLTWPAPTAADSLRSNPTPTSSNATNGLSASVQIGPGVFIPRPETESLLEWALAQPLSQHPLIVDLCTGSAALALALWCHRPGARVVAVDDSDDALAYARRNVRDTSVELLRADVTDAGLLSELDGTVELLVANPPYIP